MSQKRAFIVDDSRSARVILSRMLESYGLQVDTAESAEQALEYLKDSRPDVIFMDHLMPGMDGFQAIQAIKSNPDTALIPVIMYTSQEGELYVSQARALGAVGVLPKTVKQADVSRVLYQLHLLPERREAKSQLIAPLPGETEAQHDARTASQAGAPPANELEAAVRRAMAASMKEQNSELRRLYLAGFEAFARRLTAEIKAAGGAAHAASAQPQPATSQSVEVIEPVAPPPPAREPSRWPLLAAVVILALVPTAVLGYLHVRNQEAMRSLTDSYARVTSALEEHRTQLAALRKVMEERPVADASVATADRTGPDPESVPYGEIPLSGSRVERLRALVEDLRQHGFRGRVKVNTYVGEFCLTGNGIEGYSIASDDLPMRRCDLVGNPYDDGLSAAQRQSLAFANLVSSLRQRDSGIAIEVAHHGRVPRVNYPADGMTRLTAGEWNRIASQNNRVEFEIVETE
jgi:CheY-like chemotaxis protein